MTTTLVHQTQTQTPATAPIQLPSRFDVHQVDTVMSTLRNAAGSFGHVAVDGSTVEMIDLAALEALSTLASEGELSIEAPSVALEATLRYAGNDLLVAALHANMQPSIVRRAA